MAWPGQANGVELSVLLGFLVPWPWPDMRHSFGHSATWPCPGLGAATELPWLAAGRIIRSNGSIINKHLSIVIIDNVVH